MSNKNYILADRQYTLQNFCEIKENIFTFDIDNDILKIINDIAQKVGAPTYQKTPVFKKNRNKRKNEINSKDWENIRNFKKTTLNKTMGIDIEIDKIRSSLNKLTKQNYDIMLNDIIMIIKMVNIDEYNEEFMKKISRIIFDIGSMNKYMSHYYARIYNDINNVYNTLGKYLKDYIDQYMNSLNNIKFVNSDDNYDKFCENNKKNETIRSTSMYIVNLMNMSVIDISVIINIVHKLENMINDYINTENKKEECEELFENLRIVIVNSYDKFKYNIEYENIINTIRAISEMNSGDFKSLTNKMIFKCSDILEELDEDE